MCYYLEKGNMIASHTWSKKTPVIKFTAWSSEAWKEILEIVDNLARNGASLYFWWHRGWYCVRKPWGLWMRKGFRKVGLWTWRNLRTTLDCWTMWSWGVNPLDSQKSTCNWLPKNLTTNTLLLTLKPYQKRKVK